MTYPRKVSRLIDSNQLNAAATREIRLITTLQGAELKIAMECSGSTAFDIYEASELEDVELNRLTPLVVNRADPQTSTFTVCHTPGSAGADGALLFKILAEAGYRDAITLQLKADTAYLIRSTSNAAANRVCTTLTFTED